ncbi:MAG TPA: DUF481 domain-containing protein [Tepidisphaeraceae bacterium]|nr:DUF481 domain-containing protein [Tepidisphaeraceae bacterium]
MRKSCKILSAVLIFLLVAIPLRADQIVLKNGDKLTGKIGQIIGGSMTFTSPVLGTLTIKLADIKSYSTTEPATVQLKSGNIFHSQIQQGTPTEIRTANNLLTPIAEIKSVNPPPEVWTGSVVANGALYRGNTNSATVGISANASLRRDDPFFNDRFTLSGDYNYGSTGTDGGTITTADNADASFQYDRFLSAKLYGYGDIGYAFDRIADLNLRLTPGLGAGYQWVESPDLNFDTEGGVTYLYEDYQTSGIVQEAALRLAYHVDGKINPTLSAFNDFEYVAAYNDPANYVITADAGIQEDITSNFFSQFKVVYVRNDRPAAMRLKDDLTYLLGVGWKF